MRFGTVLLGVLTACALSVSAFAFSTPMLHFYDPFTGRTAVARLGTAADPNAFVMQANPGTFSPGWTHAVHADGNFFLMYNTQTGAGATVFSGSDGKYVTAHSYAAGHFSQGWTSILHLSNELLLFYRRSDDLAALVRVDAEGNVSPLKSFNLRGPDFLHTPGGQPAYESWTSVVNTSAGVFCYNSATGRAQLGTVDGTLGYRVKQTYNGLLSKGWTTLRYIPASDAILYFDKDSGNLAIGRIAANGTHATLKSYKFTPIDANIVVMDGTQVLFYDKDGDSAVGHVQGDGTFSYVTLAHGAIPARWTSVVYGH